MEKSQTDTQEFRLFLQEELIRRCKTNPSYSLRAFARTLGVEPSYLSKLLGQKRRVTAKTFQRLTDKLNLSPAQVAQFNESGSSAASADGASQSDANYHQLSLDQFQVIADWYHYAILELTTVKDFQPSARWIAKSLGITVTEAKAAIERLVRLELLEVTAKGKFVNISGNNSTVGNAFTSAAFRTLQKQVLEKALHALEEIPMEFRDQSSITMAIDTRRIEEAKRIIKKFRRDMCGLLQAKPPFNDVYQLSVSLYPLTKKERKSSL